MAHRRILMTGLLIAGVAAIPAIASGQTGDSTTVTSEDGSVSLEIPADAVPEGTSVEIVLRPADAAPEEVDPAAARPFYEITPADVTFSEPAIVTRRIVLVC